MYHIRELHSLKNMIEKRMKMKKTISLLLALVLCLSLCACGGGNDTPKAEAPTEVVQVPATDTIAITPTDSLVDEEKRLEAIELLKSYVNEHGTSFGGVGMYTIDTGVPDTTVYLLAQGDVLSCYLGYSIGTLKTASTESMRSTIFYLSGYENQIEGTYYIHQSNTITAAGIEMGASGAVNLYPGSFTADSEIEVVDFTPTENNSNAQLNDEFIFNTMDGLHFILETLSTLLDESELNLTLADFGFTQYEIDENRKSDIRSEAYVKEAWSLGYYADKFNAPTDEWYIHNADNWEGTFNNSVASKAQLGAKIVVDAEHISLFLYEYGNQQVKNFSSVYENEYNIIIRKEDGTQENLTGTIFASGDRVFIGEAYTDVVLDILMGEGTVQFYLEEANRPGTNYLFAVDCSNFTEIYQSAE